MLKLYNTKLSMKLRRDYLRIQRSYQQRRPHTDKQRDYDPNATQVRRQPRQNLQNDCTKQQR